MPEDSSMSELEPTKPQTARCEGVTPILRVRSLQTSLEYYVRVLGFKVSWREPGVIAAVSRDRAAIMLCQGDQGNPGAWVWIGVDDAAALFDEYTAKGATIKLEPTNYPWACEIHVEDPDRNVLRFGSEPKADRPFSAWVPWNRDAARG
jgi:catechol 2,3-dioxygenase-like lactoylglutathione lyase family enzyme